VTNRWAVLALIMAAQVMANVGPLGTLAAGMVVALLLLIPVRERAMATS
jgi:hypothetical protein